MTYGDADTEVAREVLINCAQADPHRTDQCVHGNILDRCPEELAEVLAELREKYMHLAVDEMSVEEAGLAFMDEAIPCIQQSASAEFESRHTVTAPCSMHKKACPVLPPRSIEGIRPLRAHIAGICCQDWSSMGHRQRWLGKGTEVLLTWCRERLMSDDSIVIVECVSQFDSETLRRILQEKFRMVCLDFSPSMLGEPVERHRKYMIFIDPEKLHWVHEEDDQLFFEEMFQKACKLQPAVQRYFWPFGASVMGLCRLGRSSVSISPCIGAFHGSCSVLLLGTLMGGPTHLGKVKP